MTTTAAVAVCGEKGGVGKTTSTLNLASAAISAGMKVLVADMDAQANASRALGWVDGAGPGLYEALTGKVHAGEALYASTWDGVTLMPSSGKAMSTLEASINAPDTLARVLSVVAGGVDEEQEYDLLLIDCPPSVGQLTLNALTAASLALVVTMPSAFASEGVVTIMESVRLVQEHHNPQLRLAGIICNLMPWPRTRESDLRLTELREMYGADLWEPPIPRRSVAEDANGAGRPISEFGDAALTVSGPYSTHLTRLLAMASRSPRRRR